MSIMADSVIDECFICAAEKWANQQDCLDAEVKFEDIGKRLIETCKEDRNRATAFRLVPLVAHAVMSTPVDSPRTDGELEEALRDLRRVQRNLNLAEMDVRRETLNPALLRENLDVRAYAA